MVQIAAMAMANRDERRMGLGVFARVTVTPRGAGGVLIDKRPSYAAIEAGKYASGNGGQNLVNGICP
jgi:hypothetical protein